MSAPREDAGMDTTRGTTDPENWTVYGMVYEPTEARQDRWRISAVKVVGIEVVGDDGAPEQP